MQEVIFWTFFLNVSILFLFENAFFRFGIQHLEMRGFQSQATRELVDPIEPKVL